MHNYKKEVRENGKGEKSVNFADERREERKSSRAEIPPRHRHEQKDENGEIKRRDSRGETVERRASVEQGVKSLWNQSPRSSFSFDVEPGLRTLR